MNRREKVTTFFPKCENVLHTDTEKLACELRNEVETAKNIPLSIEELVHRHRIEIQRRMKQHFSDIQTSCYEGMK